MDKLKIALVASILVVLGTISIIVYIIVKGDPKEQPSIITQVKSGAVNEEVVDNPVDYKQPVETTKQVDVIEAGAMSGYHLYEGRSFTPTRIYVMIPHYDIDPTKFIRNVRDMVGYFDDYWYFDQSRYALCIIEDYKILDNMLFINNEYVLPLTGIVDMSIKDSSDMTYVASSDADEYVVESSISTNTTVTMEPGNYTDDAGQPYIVTDDNQIIKGHYCTTEADIAFYGTSCGYEVNSGGDYSPDKWASIVVNTYPSDLTAVTENIRNRYGDGPLDHAWYFDPENSQFVILRGAIFYEGHMGFEILSADYINLDSFV